MRLPDYWLTRPNLAPDANAQKAFDELLTTTLGRGGCPTLLYNLPWPKWQFLCHVADQHHLALQLQIDEVFDPSARACSKSRARMTS